MAPDSVTAIRIIKQKLTVVPQEILKYTNLKALDLTKNRIKQIPQSLSKLEKLEVLILSKNRLEIFPVIICALPNLKHLSISDNFNVSNMPECIQYATKLEHLDIFSTGIDHFPDELSRIFNLKTLDARGILYGPVFQERWKKMMPNTDVKFDRPCNCIE